VRNSRFLAVAVEPSSQLNYHRKCPTGREVPFNNKKATGYTFTSNAMAKLKIPRTFASFCFVFNPSGGMLLLVSTLVIFFLSPAQSKVFIVDTRDTEDVTAREVSSRVDEGGLGKGGGGSSNQKGEHLKFADYNRVNYKDDETYTTYPCWRDSEGVSHCKVDGEDYTCWINQDGSSECESETSLALEKEQENKKTGEYKPSKQEDSEIYTEYPCWMDLKGMSHCKMDGEYFICWIDKDGKSECALDTLETKDTSEGRKTENSDISVGRSAIVKQGQKKNNSNSRHGESEGSEENPEKIDIHLLLR